ncbi:hypothetical protein K8353_38810 [Burkholderia contaminans]|nr:hypothetical protein [Burkholderia contaminans]
MALKTFGPNYRLGKRFSVGKPMEKVSGSPVVEVKVTTSPDPEIPVKFVGSASLPDAPVAVVILSGSYQSSGFRAAKLRLKVDQALRESDEAQKQARGSGDMVVIAR